MIYFFLTIEAIQLLAMILAVLMTLSAVNRQSLLTALETKEIVHFCFSGLCHIYHFLSILLGAKAPIS
jgi:hypothetical protein